MKLRKRLQELNNFNTREYNALALLANLCQIASFDMNTLEVSNDQIMKRLQRQDLILDEQTNIYLKRIIEQNQKIIELLENLKNK